MPKIVTARRLCTRALRRVGVVGAGQSASSEDMDDAIDDLIDMLAQWRIQRMLVYRLVDVTFTGTGATTYTIGPTGDIVVVKRPNRIEAAYVVQVVPATTNPVSYPMKVVEALEDRARITLKSLTTIPTSVYYDPTHSVAEGNGTIYPWPVPSSRWAVHLIVRDVLQDIDDLDDDIILPEEYWEALHYNLVIRLATSYTNLTLAPEVHLIAATSLSNLMASNSQIAELKMPRHLIRNASRFNVFSGEGS